MGSYTGSHNASIPQTNEQALRIKKKCRLRTASNEITQVGEGASRRVQSTSPRPEFCLGSSDT